MRVRIIVIACKFQCLLQLPYALLLTKDGLGQEDTEAVVQDRTVPMVGPACFGAVEKIMQTYVIIGLASKLTRR